MPSLNSRTINKRLFSDESIIHPSEESQLFVATCQVVEGCRGPEPSPPDRATALHSAVRSERERCWGHVGPTYVGSLVFLGLDSRTGPGGTQACGGVGQMQGCGKRHVFAEEPVGAEASFDIGQRAISGDLVPPVA